MIPAICGNPGILNGFDYTRWLALRINWPASVISGYRQAGPYTRVFGKRIDAGQSMNTKTEDGKKKSRITKKLNWLLLAMYLGIIAISIPTTYFLTKDQILEQANRELSLLVDMIRSVRNVVREETRPHFLPKGDILSTRGFFHRYGENSRQQVRQAQTRVLHPNCFG